jgi:hypothetical protein
MNQPEPQDTQANSFTPAHLERLAHYRGAVQAGIYIDAWRLRPYQAAH